MTNANGKSASCRRTSSLPPKIESRLIAYLAAGSAAGVGLLAIAQPAAAEIVYTSTYTRIHDGDPNTTLDLNNDGIADFSFNHYSSSVRWLYIQNPGPSNGVIQNTNKQCAADLLAGILIGPKQPFVDRFELMAVSFNQVTVGDWNHVQNRYLGLRFKIDGETHYGWARVTARGNGGHDAIITGYAYETVPNRPIVSGQTSGTYSDDADNPPARVTPAITTLGKLALGSTRR